MSATGTKLRGARSAALMRDPFDDCAGVLLKLVAPYTVEVRCWRCKQSRRVTWEAPDRARVHRCDNPSPGG